MVRGANEVRGTGAGFSGTNDLRPISRAVPKIALVLSPMCANSVPEALEVDGVLEWTVVASIERAHQFLRAVERRTLGFRSALKADRPTLAVPGDDINPVQRPAGTTIALKRGIGPVSRVNVGSTVPRIAARFSRR